jgi:L-2,4-diaminobutyric acid acetyltransferase
MPVSRRKSEASARTQTSIVFRKPTDEDAPGVWGLVRDCPPLDCNSRYCNLLQCTDFADTCILAAHAADGERPLGWVSGYRPPNDRSTLFIWQVAVHPDARGISLGKRMILALLRRRECQGVRSLKTTVTADNKASRGMFRSLAKMLRAPISERRHFDKQRHFDGRQDTEHLITIRDVAIGD